MINIDFVKMLARKISNKEINPKTNLPFCIEDIKKEEYINPVQEEIKAIEVMKEGEKQ